MAFADRKTVSSAVVEIARRLTEGQQLPPTDLEAIFPRVGILECRADPDLMTAGELRQAEGGYEIAYNQSESENRRRFTIAHEIAHAVMERTGPHCPRRGRELERICDLIAGQILVPEEVLATIAKAPMNLAEIGRLSRLFNSSLTMTAIRCTQQYFVACALIESDELAWFAGTNNFDLLRPSGQLKKLLQVSNYVNDGSAKCSFDLEKGRSCELNVEWTATGNERNLFVLTRCDRLSAENTAHENTGSIGNEATENQTSLRELTGNV